jgi:hypothetical protein
MKFKNDFLDKSPLHMHGVPINKPSVKDRINTSNTKIDSLNNVISDYEKELINRNNMEKALSSFKLEGIDPNQLKEEANIFFENDSDPENKTMISFVNDDKKEIGISGGDSGNTGNYFMKIPYYEKPTKPKSAFKELEKEKALKSQLEFKRQSAISKLPKAWEQRALDQVRDLGYKENSIEYKNYMNRARQLAKAAGNV